jgi:hypothetical protein
MSEVLSRVGITAKNATGYQDKFGISLAKREPVKIEDAVPAHLIATPAPETSALDKMQALIAQAQESLNLKKGKFTMWIADAPTQTIDPPAIYLAANKTTVNQTNAAHKLGVCALVSYPSMDVYPILDAGGYTSMYMHKTMDFANNPNGGLRADTVVRIIEQPKHGILEQIHHNLTDFSKFDYRYTPDAKEDYVGDDCFVMEVSAGGITVKIYYTMSVDVGQVTYILNEKNERIPDPTRCPKPNGESWKISQDANGNSTLTAVDYLPSLTANSVSATGATLASILGKGLASSIAADTSGVTLKHRRPVRRGGG